MNSNKELSGDDIMKLDIISRLVEEKEIREKNLVLNIMIGISGSGKSTYINRHKKAGDIVISPDDIRRELTGNISDQSQNMKVFETANARLRAATSNAYFDATNLTLKSIRGVMSNAKRFKKINLVILTASKNLDLCQRRVAGDISSGKDRSNVPEKVIENMHQKFMHLVQNLPEDIGKLKQEFGEDRINVIMV